MNDNFDAPGDPDLRRKLFQEGRVVFSLTSRQASIFKNVAQTDTRLRMMARRPGWTYRVCVKYLIVLGIIKTLFLSIYSQKTANALDFFLINSSDIRNVDERKTSGGQVVLTFYRKDFQRDKQ